MMCSCVWCICINSTAATGAFTWVAEVEPTCMSFVLLQDNASIEQVRNLHPKDWCRDVNCAAHDSSIVVLVSSLSCAKASFTIDARCKLLS